MAERIADFNPGSGQRSAASAAGAEFMSAVRKACHSPFDLSAPRWLLEIGAFSLRTETELLIKSRRVAPGKLLASGFTFKHPHLVPAIEKLVG